MESAASPSPPIDPQPLEHRFYQTILASALFAPLALLLAFASFAFLTLVLSRLPIHSTAAAAIFASWVVASHALFVTFLTAFIALPGAHVGRRSWVALKAGLRGMPVMILLFALAFGVGLVTPFLTVAVWALTTYGALPARIVDFGWPGLMTFGRPLPVPPSHRIALLAPSFLFLSVMAWLLRGGDWGLMDGGMVLFPMLGFTLFWGSYSAALFSAHFAWEGKA